MLTVEAAQQLVLERARRLVAQAVALSPQVLSLVLAEDVTSDLDMPPFDKSMMDGYAVQADDLRSGQGTLAVIEEVTAGQVPTRTVGTGQATRIMTGAPIPNGADAVVMIERTQTEGNNVRINDKPAKAGLNVLRRASEMRRGETVLASGVVIRPQEIGVLATVGRSLVKVVPAPRVAVLSTGDEVVEPQQTPGPGQIRNTNGPMLMAQVQRAGGVPRFLGIARDRVDSLEPLISEGLQHDVLVLSGGVSAGKLDLVPDVLAKSGVEAIFHRVSMKPGKPVFFGVKEHGDRRTLVFGLPGNPVSALVCFELFVRPALRQLKGLLPGPQFVEAKLTEDYVYRTDRPTYHAARLTHTGHCWQVAAVPWFGSPDLRGLTKANAFVVFPAGDHQHQAGQMLSVLIVEDPLFV